MTTDVGNVFFITNGGKDKKQAFFVKEDREELGIVLYDYKNKNWRFDEFMNVAIKSEVYKKIHKFIRGLK